MLSKDERDEKGNLTDMALALDAIGNHGCDCGTDEPGTCLACRCERALRTERARAEKAEEEAQDWRDSHDIVMQEKCAKDELHCTCVPSLRREIERLRGELENVVNEVVPYSPDESTPNAAGRLVSSEPTPAELVQSVLARLNARVKRAEDWKESALAVERLWDEQAVAKELKVGLGLTVRDKILPGIQSLRARAEKAEEENRRLDGELFKWKP